MPLVVHALISCIRDNKHIKFLMNYINENIKLIMQNWAKQIDT